MLSLSRTWIHNEAIVAEYLITSVDSSQYRCVQTIDELSAIMKILHTLYYRFSLNVVTVLSNVLYIWNNNKNNDKKNNNDKKKSMDEEEKNKVLWTRTGTGVRKRIFKFFSGGKEKQSKDCPVNVVHFPKCKI